MTKTPYNQLVLDTSVVIHIHDKTSDASHYLNIIKGSTPVISFQTREELFYGAYRKNWGKPQINELELYLDKYKIIWPTYESLDISAKLRGNLKSAGRKLRIADAWIAATAIMLNCPLVSSDKDFRNIPGLKLIE